MIPRIEEMPTLKKSDILEIPCQSPAISNPWEKCNIWRTNVKTIGVKSIGTKPIATKGSQTFLFSAKRAEALFKREKEKPAREAIGIAIATESIDWVAIIERRESDFV